MKQKEDIGLLTMASYGMGKYLAEFLTGAFGAVVYKFYETEIGLAPLYAAYRNHHLFCVECSE